jgi:A/G-specific adenine glycosylase
MNTTSFKKAIWNYYKKHGRDLPWRNTCDPYNILVSEVMLQQTQVPRVILKYNSFLKKFPTTGALAKAKLADVLAEWQGLGYNRRAINLKRAAEVIEKDFGGEFPKDFKALTSLPGIGPTTAGDILAFSYNIAVPVIETNIRSVFIHFFFKDKEGVTDKEIMPLIEKTLDQKDPREWYYALFDYGAELKKSGNPNKKSAHYARQSTFKGSHREKRSKILKCIIEKPQRIKDLEKLLALDPSIIKTILAELETEGFIKKFHRGFYSIS